MALSRQWTNPKVLDTGPVYRRTRAVNIAIKYRNTWYRRYFFQYRTKYCNSFILLVSHAYRRYFLIVLPILDTNTLFWVISLLLRDSFLWGWRVFLRFV